MVRSSVYGADGGDYAGQKLAVYFELQGQPDVAINGAGMRFEANESVSLAIPCDTQEEIDRLWDARVERVRQVTACFLAIDDARAFRIEELEAAFEER